MVELVSACLQLGHAHKEFIDLLNWAIETWDTDPYVLERAREAQEKTSEDSVSNPTGTPLLPI